jgi:hypothetical protein
MVTVMVMRARTRLVKVASASKVRRLLHRLGLRQPDRAGRPTTDLDLTDLQNDGNTIELTDGRRLRMRIEVDQDASINDYEADGRVEWTRDNSYGSQRPADFTGRARNLDHSFGSTLWWEIPAPEMIGDVWTDAEMRSQEARIRKLVEYGFSVVTLELLDGADAYGRPVVTQYQRLGGIDSVDNGEYLTELVRDLLAQMDL